MDDGQVAPAPGLAARGLARMRGRWLALVLATLAVLVVLVQIAIVVAPAFHDLRTLGGHDWDEMESQRYLAIKTLTRYREFPFWNPYACGGFDAWGNIQGDTNLVSPWFPVYLLLPLNLAVRTEVVGIVLLSALGTWLWAGSFTRSPALRAFVCVVFVANGRWALQAATGHGWHLYYAWVPWTLYFHGRAMGSAPLSSMRWRDVVMCGACIALMVYSGAIYPLPHAALLLGLYALALAIAWRTPKPLVAGAVAGAIGFGLAAPKLLPVLENVARFPRLVDSSEAIDLHTFVRILIAPIQDVSSRPAPIPQWGWHEYGMYIGLTAAVAIFTAKLFARGARERALLLASVTALLLGFGSFDEYAPWTLLHKHVPIFQSQHVPTRWLYPWVLFAATLAVAVGERALVALRAWRTPVEIALLACVGAIAVDIALVANVPMQRTFWMQLPEVQESTGEYHQESRVPASLRYATSDYGPPALPATLANVGVIECTLHAGLNVWARSATGPTKGAGARGQGDADYRGEAYTVSGVGTAKVTRFTPNSVVVEVEGATAGDILILNQNWDAGWKVNGSRAINHADAVGTPIGKPSGRYEFRFRSRLFNASLAIGVVTVGLIAAAAWAGRRRTAARVASTGRRLGQGASAPAEAA